MKLSWSKRRFPAFAYPCLPAAFLLIFFMAGPILAVHAADYTVVQGIVERVSGARVTVSGHDFDITAARLVSPEGAELRFSEIASGRKVSLHLKRGGVATVVVYPAFMVE